MGGNVGTANSPRTEYTLTLPLKYIRFSKIYSRIYKDRPGWLSALKSAGKLPNNRSMYLKHKGCQ